MQGRFHSISMGHGGCCSNPWTPRRCESRTGASTGHESRPFASWPLRTRMPEPRRNEYTPDIVTPPGETLLEVLEARGMTQAELAERMGRPKKTISELIN